jgi:predicted Zn finger-like uncharacterized protein
LIVTCAECSTSFQLDEARIPEAGARVRCSRCKHAFFLPHPSTRPIDAVHTIASEVAADASPGAPSVSADLVDAEPDPGEAPRGVEPEAEEDDWEFNEEVRIEGDEEPDLAAEDDFDADESDFGEGFDESALSADVDAGDLDSLDGVEPPDLADRVEGPLDISGEPGEMGESGLELNSPDSGPAASDAARDESSFGSVEDFSSLMEDEEVVPDPLADPSAPQIGEADLEAGGLGLHAASGPSDDLGDPENWDLIGSDPGGRGDSSRRGSGGALGGTAGKLGFGVTADFIDGFGVAPIEEEAGDPSLLARWGVRLGNAVGWAFTLAMIAAVLYVGLVPEWMRWSQAAQTVSEAPFFAETTESGWIETSRSGPVLMIRGRMRNVGAEAIWPRPVQIALLDGSGERLAAPPIFGGTPLDESVLREAEPEVLAAARSAAVDQFLRTPLAAGEVRPFEILVDALPPEARRMLLEIGESRPASSTHPGSRAARRIGAPGVDANAGTESEAALTSGVGRDPESAGGAIQADGSPEFSP